MVVHAIIVAAGKGLRAAGDGPKQFQLLGSKPLYQWSLEAFETHPAVQQIALVVPSDRYEYFASKHQSERIKIIAGGRKRTTSVRAGLKALDARSNHIVMIHDAARPGLDATMISSLIDTLSDADAAAPALPLADALKRLDGDSIRSITRDDLYRVQTPQAFYYGKIQAALETTSESFVDDLAAIEASGGKIRLVQGDERLSKVTWPDDLNRMEKILRSETLSPRIGTGFDVHAFGPGDHVTLCGLKVAHSKGLIGHSDADVAWHTLTDAILGALALGDIGDHFPPSDKNWKGAESSLFLKHASDLAYQAGYLIANCDITLICEQPKIGPHREAMRETTARLLALPLSSISVKATTTERLGFTGRGEGIAAQAACMLVPK